MHEFRLPAIGEGVVEGEIVRWLKAPGDPVAANEGIVEVMTDKATVEIPCPRDAVLQEIKTEEGNIAAVGEVIAILGEAGAAVAATGPAVAAAKTTARATGGTAAAPSSPTVVPAAATPAPVAAVAPVPSSNGSSGRVDQILATPAARALARETGIDLTAVPADRGRITKRDVLQAQAAPAPSPVVAPQPRPTAPSPSSTPAPATAATDETIPFRGMRRRIAEGMTKAYTTAVHYTYVEQIDVSRLVAVRNQAKEAARQEGVSLSYLPFIVKAVIRGLKKYPIVNAELDEPNARIVLKKRYDIGIATATEQGLMVPVVKDADKKSLLEIAAEVARLSEAARTGKASRDELTGSTFTITSLGTIGGVLATPILNYPEVGILGVHAIRKTPVVDDNDQIVIGHLMNLSVSLDHRVVDGFEGANFLQEVRRYLEDPTLLLLAGI
jgi:pyruvate dehydrogenase E2 component (dihydrolipoamide acetyltransferase)